MIITMKNTETREISAKIDELHEERGEAALGRVLTLLISTNETSLEHDLAVANNASREHPCRVIAIAPNSRRVMPLPMMVSRTPFSTRKCDSVPTPARAKSSCCVRLAGWFTTLIHW